MKDKMGMKTLTDETARKYRAMQYFSLHEAVCLALDLEPSPERPANPSEEYLYLEGRIYREVFLKLPPLKQH